MMDGFLLVVGALRCLTHPAPGLMRVGNVREIKGTLLCSRTTMSYEIWTLFSTAAQLKTRTGSGYQTQFSLAYGSGSTMTQQTDFLDGLHMDIRSW
ncbi:hypothetical protein DPMN_114998 [Dreissena polymorpha]|uniref:Secreted protein n=1 Tax=Dreissena polymorpha TaxID=45954 RepID=A0A9D4QSZ9_DREPO|nr:hypothetical protein DPMN_114998 [Dreissena polymorpha]